MHTKIRPSTYPPNVSVCVCRCTYVEQVDTHDYFASQTRTLACVILLPVFCVFTLIAAHTRRKDFEKRIAQLRGQLDTVISNNFENELNHVSEHILETVGPYSRFVKVEQKKIEANKEQLLNLRQRVRDIRALV